MDTSPFRRFYEAELPVALPGYLNARGFVVPAVKYEIDLLTGRLGRYVDFLARLQFPLVTDELSDELNAQALALAQGWPRNQPDNALEHLGEAATVLAARHLEVPLVIVDDSDARRLLRGERYRHIHRLSTVALACEMVHRRALTEEEGWRVFEVSTIGTSSSDFGAALARAATRLES